MTIAEIHATVPRFLFAKSTVKGLLYTVRSAGLCVLLFALSLKIDAVSQRLHELGSLKLLSYASSGVLWAVYCWIQGIAFAGLWCLGTDSVSPDVSVITSHSFSSRT